MSGLRRAELILLARELRVDVDELAFLAKHEDEDLRRLRLRMATALDRQHARLFRAMAKASHLVPKGMAARIGMSQVGPVFCGRMATELAPEHAAKFMEHVTPAFMADCCPHIRPDKLGPLAAGLPDSVIQPVMRLLLERGEHVTIAQFVGEVPERLVVTSMQSMSPEDIARVMIAAPDLAVFEGVIAGLATDIRRATLASAHELGAPDPVLELLDRGARG